MKFAENISNTIFNAIKERAVFSDIYSFFDVAIAMKSDKQEQLDWFRRLYPRFRVEKAKTEKIDVTYYMMVETPYVGTDLKSAPYIVAEENSCLKVKVLDDVDSLASYAYLLAYNYITAHLKSHFLLHAAVVSWNDDGLAIVGSSGSGKTTLMLELLLKKGFRFLSDDQLVINRTTHKINPFPRSVGIRESALELFDNLELEHLEPQTVIGQQRKWFVDISEISENGIGEPCRLKYLVFLVNSLDEEEANKNVEQQVELAVGNVNDKLLKKLRPLARGGKLNCRRMRNCYALIFYPETEMLSAFEYERFCQSCNVWLLDMRQLTDVKPDFDQVPKIRRIPQSIAAMELLKELKNDLRGNPTQAFWELADLLSTVECYQLATGRLDEKVNHICNLVLNSP